MNHVLHMQRPRLLAMADPLTTVSSIYKTTNEKVMSMRHACLGHCEQDELGSCVYNYRTDKNKYSGPVDHCTCGGPLYV